MAYGREEKYEIGLISPAHYFTPVVVTFILIMIAGFVLTTYWERFVLNQLALTPSRLLHGCVWQLVTYSFVDVGVWSLIWNCSCVLVIGSMLEREWGKRSFLSLWFTAGIVCGLIWCAVSLAITLLGGQEYLGISADGCVYGLLGAFGLAFRRRRYLFFFWGMPAEYVVYLLVAIGLLVGIPHPITWIWVAGAVVAYLYLKLIWWMREGFPRGGVKEQARFKDLG